jgi:hypothetical protein
LVVVALLAQLDNLAQQVMEQAAVILYFLLLHLLAVVEVLLVALPVLGKQAVLVVVAVTMVALVVLETPHPHPQVKVTMVEHLMPPTMAAVAVAGLLPLVQQPPLRLLVALVALAQHQASVVLQ